MAAKINRTVMIDGERRWIHANTEQEYADKLLSLTQAEQKRETAKHEFKPYALNWYTLYSKPNIATVTAETYKRQLDKYLIPAFEGTYIEDITTDSAQALFNEMKGAKATKDKCRVVLNMILESALDDKIIDKNPLKSRRFKVTGAESENTKVYSAEQMRYLVGKLDRILDPTDRNYLALQALHPLRLEEVLGLQWGDIDFERREIHIQRVATHPKRNQPEIKEPKTKASTRTIGLTEAAAKHLTRGEDGAFIIGGEKPYSYQQVKRMCDRIQRDTGFSEKITPIRFRTTVLTDIYDQTRDAKAAQKAAGHTTTAMTMKYYIKGRTSAAETARAIDQAYSD